MVLGGCTGAVDNPEHPDPPSATLPLRGTQRPEVGLPHGPEPEVGSPHAPALGGGLAHASGPTAAAGSAAGSFDVPGVPPRAPGFEVGALPDRVAAPGSASVPVRLVIPEIGVATRLVRLGLEPEGGMQVPGNFGDAGWFAGGPVPGQVGPAVIAGHVDSKTGPAVFYELGRLHNGDAVYVRRRDGSRVRFTVEGSRHYSKDHFPTARVYAATPLRRSRENGPPLPSGSRFRRSRSTRHRSGLGWTPTARWRSRRTSPSRAGGRVGRGRARPGRR